MTRVYCIPMYNFHYDFLPEALMNAVSSYEATYWLEQISHKFLICMKFIITKTAFQSKAHHPLADRKSQLVHQGGTPAGPSGGTPAGQSRGWVHFCVHFQGVHFHVHFWGAFSVHFQGGPLLCFTSGRVHFCVYLSHVTYPIMLLYTTIECPSASWAKFTWNPPQSWTD